MKGFMQDSEGHPETGDFERRLVLDIGKAAAWFLAEHGHIARPHPLPRWRFSERSERLDHLVDQLSSGFSGVANICGGQIVGASLLQKSSYETGLLVHGAPSEARDQPGLRSEERRVGKECRSRWSAYQEKKKKKNERDENSKDVV